MIKVKIINRIEDKVKEYQEQTGCTKSWIAKQINIKRQTLNTIEKSQNPTIEVLVKLSIILKCEITDLFSSEIYQDGKLIIK